MKYAIFILTAFILCSCGTTKHFYYDSDCEKIEGGYVCEK